MNKALLEALLHWPRTYISGMDLCHLLNKSPDSRYAIVKRALQEGYLLSIRRDLYLIKNHPKHSLLDLFALAPIIYGPSYVSFESALSFHGWIPEAVRVITCASVKKAREFNSPLGTFAYKRIPIKAFPFGVESHFQNTASFLMASPWKALADMIYANQRTWNTIQDLSRDLRIEMEHLELSDKTLLTGLITDYPSVRVQKVLHRMQKGLSS